MANPKREHEKALRKLLATPPDTHVVWAQIQQWILSPSSHPADDRDSTLIAFNCLENGLASLLILHLGLNDKPDKSRILFIGDGEKDGILSAAVPRAILAYSLDLIGNETLKDIKTINHIRNTFAHSGHVIGYDHPALTGLSNLGTLKNLPDNHNVSTQEGTPILTLKLQNPRSKIFSFILYFDLYCRLNQTESAAKKSLRQFFD